MSNKLMRNVPIYSPDDGGYNALRRYRSILEWLPLRHVIC